MADEYRPLTREELSELAGEELPERAAMSLINANLAAPVNAAVAANVLSDNSVAFANAEQTANITQSNYGLRQTEEGPALHPSARRRGRSLASRSLFFFYATATTET